LAELLVCPSCRQDLPAEALSCPACRQLVHAGRLDELSRQAKTHEAAASHREAAIAWRQALDLLPPDSNQAVLIRDRIATLGAAARVAPAKPRPAWIKKLGPLAGAALLLWKFKAALLIVLGKGKFLLLGLGKFKTLLSMLATIGLYWSWYGWKFAVGFVLAIYVHEMGHVWALRRFGLRASAPMFIPGFGAFVSLYDSPANAGQDARIGLAGPIWGAAAAMIFLAPGLLLGGGFWFAVARATAWLNLLNLTPVWTLDGGRAFRALDSRQRFYIGALLILLWLATSEGLFLIPIAGVAYQIFWKKDAPAEGDRTILLQYAGLAALFAALMAAIPVRQ
jgi:Zn-dependent protease